MYVLSSFSLNSCFSKNTSGPKVFGYLSLNRQAGEALAVGERVLCFS